MATLLALISPFQRYKVDGTGHARSPRTMCSRWTIFVQAGCFSRGGGSNCIQPCLFTNVGVLIRTGAITPTWRIVGITLIRTKPYTSLKSCAIFSAVWVVGPISITPICICHTIASTTQPYIVLVFINGSNPRLVVFRSKQSNELSTVKVTLR